MSRAADILNEVSARTVARRHAKARSKLDQYDSGVSRTQTRLHAKRMKDRGAGLLDRLKYRQAAGQVRKGIKAHHRVDSGG